MKHLLLIFTLCSFSLLSFAEDNPEGVACAIYVDDKSNTKEQILSMGCKKGDPLLFYNYANKAKWNLMYSLRISALSTCDMTLPITDSGGNRGATISIYFLHLFWQI
jgi:hypothetical protein